MKPSNLFKSDDRAVSPVIGVILMVAITVILAAVIGTFVLGLGDSLGNDQPTAQLNLEVDNGTQSAALSHGGGDSVQLGNLEIIALNGTDQRDRQVVADVTSADSDFSVGDTASIDYSGSGDVDTIRVIHTPSDSIILERSVDIAGGFDSWTTV